MTEHHLLGHLDEQVGAPAEIDRSSTQHQQRVGRHAQFVAQSRSVTGGRIPASLLVHAHSLLVDAPSLLIDAPSLLIDAPSLLIDAPSLLIDAIAEHDELLGGQTVALTQRGPGMVRDGNDPRGVVRQRLHGRGTAEQAVDRHRHLMQPRQRPEPEPARECRDIRHGRGVDDDDALGRLPLEGIQQFDHILPLLQQQRGNHGIEFRLQRTATQQRHMTGQPGIRRQTLDRAERAERDRLAGGVRRDQQ